MLDSYISVANNEFRKAAAISLGKRKVFEYRREIFRRKKQKTESKDEQEPRCVAARVIDY